MIDKNTNNNKTNSNEFRDEEDFRLLDAQFYINAIKLTYI